MNVLTQVWTLIARLRMAVMEEVGQAAHDRVQQPSGTALQMLTEKVCKQTLEDWRDSAAEYVRKLLFDKKQFVSDADLAMGGDIQKLVCAYIHISGGERAREFWEEKGGREADSKKHVQEKEAGGSECTENCIQG